jgi:hypothetical protein
MAVLPRCDYPRPENDARGALRRFAVQLVEEWGAGAHRVPKTLAGARSMKTTSVAVALLSVCLCTAPALAQQGTPAQAPAPAGVPSQPQPQRAPADADRARSDVDARACLEFVANPGVIRCAEKYRYRRAAPAVGPSAAGRS